MTDSLSSHPIAFTENAKAAFHQYLLGHPSSRRISRAEKDDIIRWLKDPNCRPSSQKEFSRRNYVRKTFCWDDDTQTLLAVASKDGDKNRVVVTADDIPDVVGLVHNENGHAGWDATWKAISHSYYGILRADTIFLLKECQVCAGNPRKRPKGHPAFQNSETIGLSSDNPSSFEELFPLLETNHGGEVYDL